MQSYQVETGDVAISDAIIAIAKARDFPVRAYLLATGKDRPYLIINNEGTLSWNAAAFNNHKTVTVAEFVKLLKSKREPPNVIGRYKV